LTAEGSHPLLRAFCDELARCGMTDACTSPGSRSAPLVLALVREPGLRCWSHIDERCAGFFALGLAKASGRPVAIACTSGTAAANLAPAVHEAREARVPLIVLTADRPPELRDVGAGQVIDQVKLYGAAAKLFVEVGVDGGDPGLVAWMRQLACRAWSTAQDGRPGVVHLNFPLREPLVPRAPMADDHGGRAGGAPWVARHAPMPRATARLRGADGRRGVVVAGRSDDPAVGVAAAQLARASGWPILADPLSGGRRGPAAIAHYDALLRDDRAATELAPEVVLRVGDLPTSKPLRTWLAAHPGARQVALDPEMAWQDPSASVAEVIAAGPGDVEAPEAADPAWLERWRALDAAVAAAIDRALGDELSEPRVAREIGSLLPADGTLFAASSMPVRDVETFFPARPDPPRVLSNRGANGIDGTVSSAFGVAAAAQGLPVVLLIGDVALAHDLGGLLASRRLALRLTIVLLDNDGGGIFHFLPIAEQADAFEEHVATPHGLDAARAAALFGCAHHRVASVPEFRDALIAAMRATETTIIEVRTDRGENVALHRRVSDQVSRALA
jgi:2-succinyl-5-enolpyruvyl-6-hydroxy-3-cyclohexene-1-carboxylate synthase